MHPLRRTAEAILPHILPARAAAAPLAMIDRYGQYRRYKRSDAPAAIRAIETRFGLEVRGGPFRGMLYPAECAYSRHSIPRLLGCYEQELHPAIGQCLGAGYRRFVDIGCAEGYYTVGFALAAGWPVEAFEVEPWERRRARMMAKANGVDGRVRVQGWCSSATLRQVCPDRSLILCDCEGYEAVLFTAEMAGALRHSDLIVELHEVQGIDTARLMRERFAATHDIDFVTARPRRASDYPELAELALAEDRWVSEFRRPGQQWAIIHARAAFRSA